MTFREHIEKELVGLSKEQQVTFAWQCAVQALPFLGVKGNFDFWKDENKQQHLAAIFRSLDISLVYIYTKEIIPRTYPSLSSASSAASAASVSISASYAASYAAAAAAAAIEIISSYVPSYATAARAIDSAAYAVDVGAGYIITEDFSRQSVRQAIINL